MSERELAGLISLVMWVFIHLIGSFVLSRVGKKFGIGTTALYFVPVYNMMLISRCAGLAPWVGAVTWAFAFNLLLPGLPPPLPWLFSLATLAASVYVWGHVAQQMGKNFWLWGLACGLLWLPALALAFDASQPIRRHGIDGQTPHAPWPVGSLVYEPVVDAHVPEDDVKSIYEPVISVGLNAPPGRRSEGVAAGVQGTVTRQRGLILRFKTGEYAGEEIEVPPEGLVIGRDPQRAGLILASPEVSGRHLLITTDPEKDYIVLTDYNSTNGTFIHQNHTGTSCWVRVQGTHRELFSYDPCRVRLGETAAEFEVHY